MKPPRRPRYPVDRTLERVWLPVVVIIGFIVAALDLFVWRPL
jgi:hypothetical protein